MRVLLLIVVAALIAALVGLEVASSRTVTAAAPLPASTESAPGYWE